LTDERRPLISVGDRGSLRRRLTITYTLALAVGLLIYTTLSLATIDRATVRRLLSELGIQQSGAILMQNGDIPVQSTAIPKAVLAVARDTRNGALRYSTVAAEGGLRVVSTLIPNPDGSQAIAVIWRPLDVITDYERVAAETFGITGLIIIGIAFVVGSMIVAQGMRPLQNMATVASEIEARDLSRRLSNGTWDTELQAFAATFDRMLDRLESAFLRQRQFTADASHDLRAPLTVIRAEVDLALTRGRQANFDEAAFRSIRDEVQEFDRLLEALLLAARADAGPIKSQPVDLGELAVRASSRILPFAASRLVRIENDIQSPAMIVGDADILERVFISLLHNGIKFSPENGTVTIAIADSTNTISIIVRDEGPGFSREALVHAFDRFWRDDTARGRSGSGLGLAIAKTAIERAGGSIYIRNVRAGGAEIETVFPVPGGLP
jgi:signal transduction histidine kinase